MKPTNITRHHVVVALTIIWSMLFVHTVKATTINEFMGGYDQSLLEWAAGTALLGGGIRTIFSLESDRRIIREIVNNALWDTGKSLAAGMLAFIVIQAIRSGGVLVSNEIRFTAVLVAGWGRMAAFDWILTTGKEWLEARKAQIVNKPLDEKEKS